MLNPPPRISKRPTIDLGFNEDSEAYEVNSCENRMGDARVPFVLDDTRSLLLEIFEIIFD